MEFQSNAIAKPKERLKGRRLSESFLESDLSSFRSREIWFIREFGDKAVQNETFKNINDIKHLIMIITKTPLRVSFAGGGTDLRSYYARYNGGAVTSTAIDKYIYVTVNKKFDDKIRVSYSKTEIVDSVDELKHGLVREAMKLTGVTSGVEITTIADIPSHGTGLGSSSTLTVGLLNALYAYKGILASPQRLAEDACKIEIDILQEPNGKQDQYIASFGGIQHIRFNPDESVHVQPVICPVEVRKELEENLMLFYTGIERKARDILKEQNNRTEINIELLNEMKKQSEEVRDALLSHDVDEVGYILDRAWNLKKQLSSGISNEYIDELYRRAKNAGAIGGKITGAGGGGFLLLYCRKYKQKNVIEELKELKYVPFRFDLQGSRFIHVSD